MDSSIVLPGDFLSTEMEFSSGFNTFQDDNGSIFSTVYGKVIFDEKNREVNVDSFKPKIKLHRGTIVFGIIGMVRDNFAQVKIFKAEFNEQERIISSSYATLPVRNVSRDFVKNLKEEFKIGDIIKAKVAEVKPWGIDLRTNERDLGVIKAYSAHSREPMYLFGTQLKCLSSGYSERRKISSEYLLKN